MRRMVLISLMILGAVGCESGPPDTELCVASPIQGERLRLMVAYFDDGTLVETTHDQPFTQRTCLTLRRPTVAARPQTKWEVELDAQGRIEHQVWPLDVAIYDDANGNAAIDEGELRGSLSAEEGRLPALLLDYEEIATIWASIDEADEVTVSLREFVWASARLDRPGYSDRRPFERLPEAVEINANASACGAIFYPMCVPERRYRSSDEIIVLDEANLDEATYLALLKRFDFFTIWPIFEITKPATYCEVYDEYRTATYVYETDVANAETCACVHREQRVFVHTGLESMPDWLDCSTASSRNDTFIIGLQAEPTSTSRSSE